MVNLNELRRECKILELSLPELSERIEFQSQHALGETFVFPIRQTVKLMLLPWLLQRYFQETIPFLIKCLSQL
jgi:hypothetical protein